MSDDEYKDVENVSKRARNTNATREPAGTDSRLRSRRRVDDVRLEMTKEQTMEDSPRLPGTPGGVEAEWDGGASDRAAWAEAVWEDDARGMPWIAADGEQASIP